MECEAPPAREEKMMSKKKMSKEAPEREKEKARSRSPPQATPDLRQAQAQAGKQVRRPRGTSIACVCVSVCGVWCVCRMCGVWCECVVVCVLSHALAQAQLATDLARRGNVQQAFKQLEKTQVRMRIMHTHNHTPNTYTRTHTHTTQDIPHLLPHARRAGVGRVAVLPAAAQGARPALLRQVGGAALPDERVLGT